MPIRTWPGEVLSAQNGQAWWGANSSAGRGRMNYQSVQFAITALGTVAEYKAGFEGNPLTAPDPTNQAWTVVAPTTPGTVISAPVSPDTEALAGGTPGFVALEFDERGLGFPRLFGRYVDIGAYEVQTSYEIRFVHIEYTTTGVLLRARSEANTPLTIQWNTDPMANGWQPLVTGATDASGNLQHTDTGAFGGGQRFYRAVRP